MSFMEVTPEDLATWEKSIDQMLDAKQNLAYEADNAMTALPIVHKLAEQTAFSRTIVGFAPQVDKSVEALINTTAVLRAMVGLLTAEIERRREILQSERERAAEKVKSTAN